VSGLVPLVNLSVYILGMRNSICLVLLGVFTANFAYQGFKQVLPLTTKYCSQAARNLSDFKNSLESLRESKDRYSAMVLQAYSDLMPIVLNLW